jgi:glycogen debranching enzyme
LSSPAAPSLPSAIRFGTEITGDLACAEGREWLITNGLGSYGSGTVAGSLTRTYHGLLVAALGAPADPCARTLLVTALVEEAEVGHRSHALAHARVHGDPAGGLRLLEPIGHHLATAGLGSVSEIFDGDAPHAPRGCIAQAWSVAEVLRAWVELGEMKAI